MKRGKNLLLIVFLVIIPLIYAAPEFEVRTKTIKNIIYINETASFNITIQNNMLKIDQVQISSPDIVDWDIFTEPRRDYSVEVFPESQRNVLFMVKPMGHMIPGIYTIRLDILSTRSNTHLQKNVEVEVRSGIVSPKEYVPSIKTALKLPRSVDPRRQMDISVRITNLFPIWLENMRVEIYGDYFKKSYTTSLGPKDEKDIEFSHAFDSQQKPGKDTIRGVIYLTHNNRTYIWEIESQEYEILSFQSFGEEKLVRKELFKIVNTINVQNDGNSKDRKEVKFETNLIKRIFSKTEPKATFIYEDGKSYYKWEVGLEPKNLVSLAVIENYRIIPILLIIIIVITISYYYFRSPVIIKKNAFKLSEGEGINDLKVRLYIKNRSNRVIEQVKLVDRIPSTIEVEKDFHLGTIRPDRLVKNPPKPTKAIWNISSLDPFEERIITYRIKSKLSIVGGVTLPSGYIKIKNSRGKDITTHSNVFDLQE